jgi:glycosyltransferase involved in cell wall biosynthesis
MSGVRRVAYLSSVYPRATDSFVREEIAALRALDFDIETFSVRRPPADQLTTDSIRAEAKRTVDLLHAGPATLLKCATRALCFDPRRTASTLALAWSTRAPGLRGLVRVAVYVVEALFLAERLKASGVAHLHNHIAGNSASVAMLASEQSGIPWSTTVHGMELLEAGPLALGAKLDHAAFTACISHYTRSQCMLHAQPESWDRLHVIRCGLGPEFLDAKAAPLPTRVRFVCVGRLSTEKGQRVLLEATARLLAEGVELELVLVGDGDERPGLEKRIRTLGLAGSVRITGWADRERVREEIESARALVIPSFSEGLPVVAMEALALGRPVIATQVGGVAELIETGVTGWLVAPGSVGALLDAMREVAHAETSSLSALAAEGAQRVARSHDARREAARLAEHFSGRWA